MPEGRVAVVAVGLAAVLDSVLEDDGGLTFSRLVVSRLFFVLVTLLPHWLRGVIVVETGNRLQSLLSKIVYQNSTRQVYIPESRESRFYIFYI